MSLGFPDESRFYDSAVHAVRFSGYDGALEAPFFVGERALKRIQPDMPLGMSPACCAPSISIVTASMRRRPRCTSVDARARTT